MENKKFDSELKIETDQFLAGCKLKRSTVGGIEGMRHNIKLYSDSLIGVSDLVADLVNENFEALDKEGKAKIATDKIRELMPELKKIIVGG